MIRSESNSCPQVTHCLVQTGYNAKCQAREDQLIDMYMYVHTFTHVHVHTRIAQWHWRVKTPYVYQRNRSSKGEITWLGLEECLKRRRIYLWRVFQGEWRHAKCREMWGNIVTDSSSTWLSPEYTWRSVAGQSVSDRQGLGHKRHFMS